MHWLNFNLRLGLMRKQVQRVHVYLFLLIMPENLYMAPKKKKKSNYLSVECFAIDSAANQDSTLA